MTRTAATIRLAALLIAAALTTQHAIPQAVAQTRVNVPHLTQTQRGTHNTQKIDIGNAKHGGSTNVQVQSIYQAQDGHRNRQELRIGNTRGGHTNVTTGNITQIQRGVSNECQQLNIGNNSHVQTGDIVQLGKGRIEIGYSGREDDLPCSNAED